MATIRCAWPVLWGIISKTENWIGEKLDEDKVYLAKFRYRGVDNEVKIKQIDEDKFEVFYPNKAKAVTPGQAAVFYDGERLVGGGTIDEVYMDSEKRQY